MMIRGDLLKKTSLFSEFGKPELARLSEHLQERKISAGSRIFEQGTRATSMFLIASGSVEITRDATATDTRFVVAELPTGALFGEMPFVDAGPRAAAATAKTDCELLELTYSDLRRLIEDDPRIGLKVYQSIAHALCCRIRQTTAEYASMLLP